jgi:hypothetical protein
MAVGPSPTYNLIPFEMEVELRLRLAVGMLSEFFVFFMIFVD